LVLGALGGALVLLTVVGWLDDHRSMSIIRRLPFHVLCSVAVASLVNEVAPIPGPANILWLAWWILWSVASINIVNFMDGIDGMVASQGVVYGLFLFALIPAALPASRFGLILAGACLGFLIWNWAPAKMFMGDVGSGPLGLLLVIGGAFAINDGASSFLVFLPLFPLFFDALATIILRYRVGESILEPHRAHLYQRVANSGVGHAMVSTSYALAAAIGAIIAFSVKDAPSILVDLSIAAYCIAVVGAWLAVNAKFRHRSPGRSAAPL
jgi:UDP-N-acetylmuramyl pentapeptide phosphotransferase/UDP-N-acetylglucosamine-1-phosphate transferase